METVEFWELVRWCVCVLRLEGTAVKGSIVDGEVELDSSTNADRLRLILLDERRGNARGPLGIREEDSWLTDGVGAVTMTLVGPFMIIFISFCLEKAGTSLKVVSASVWPRAKLAGISGSWLSSENVDRNSCEAGLSSEKGGCVIRLDRARGTREVLSERGVGIAENREGANVKSDELSEK